MVALLSLVAALLIPAPAAHAETTTIGFDDLSAGAIVTTQYAEVDGVGRGVVFNPDTRPGAVPVNAVSPRTRSFAGASAPLILDTSGCAGEFCEPSVVARFSDSRSFVAVRAGVWEAGASARIQLTAYNAAGAAIGDARADVSSSGCNFAAACALRVDAAGIRYFAIQRVSGSARIGIDDLAFERPSVVARAYSLVWDGRVDGSGASVDAVGLRQGFSSTTGIVVDRVGGSTGTLTFSAAGLPAGVSASFSPASTSTAATTLTLTATPHAPVFDGSITVTATSGDPAASGPSPQSTTVPLRVRPNFAIAGDPRFSVAAPAVDVAPCTATTADVPVFVPAAFGSPDAGMVTRRFTGVVGVGSPGAPFGVSFSVAPASVTLDQASRSVTVSVRAASGALSAPTPLTLRASAAPYADSTGSILLRPVPGAVADVSPAAVRTPMRLQAGSVVTVRGSGFCPDSVVRFGNDRAPGGEVAVSSDGRTLTARVPRLATSGPLTIVSGGVELTSTRPVVVDSFRNTVGFRAPNSTNAATFGDLTQAFGADQTTTSIFVNPCWPLSCPVKVATVNNAYAEQIIDTNPGTGGLCFGYSLLGLRLAVGDASLSAFPPAGARTAWQLDGTDRPSPSLLRAITVAHLAQYSQQYKSAKATFGGGDGPAIRKRVQSALAAGDGPIIAIRQGGSGHAMVAYDVEDDPSAAGAFFVYLWDSNMPHLVREDSDGAAHAARVTSSRLRVAPDGSWSFPNLSWSGNSSALWAVPYGTLKGKLTLSKDLLGVIFSTASTGARTEAITRDGTARLDAGGEPTGSDVVRDAPAEPGAPPVDWYILKGDGRWSQAIRSSRPISHGIEGRNFAASLKTRSGASGRLAMSPAEAGLGWSGGAAATLTVAAGNPATARVASLQLGRAPAGTSTALAFTRDRAGVVVRHRGPSRSVRLSLGAGGQQLSVRLRLTGRTTSIRPLSWSDLTRGARAGGRLLRGRVPAPAVRVVAADVRRAGGRRLSLRITSVIRKLPPRSTVTLAWGVTSANKPVLRRVRTLVAPRAGRRTDAITIDRPKGARLRFVATAVAVRSGPTAIATTSRRVTMIRR